MKVNLDIDDDSLIKECVKGNTDALNHFYSRFAPKMFGVVIRYVNNPDDARDILHDGFIVAFTRLKSLRSPESVEYWLASIMKNLSLQFLQSQDVVTVLHELPEVEETPEFSDIIDLHVLETLIQKLPKGYQTVFRLSVLENKTHKDIAKILGIAPNSSSSQLFHAKLMMRKLINEYRNEAGLLSLLLIIGVTGLLRWHNNDNLNNVDTTFSNKTALLTGIITKENSLDNSINENDIVSSIQNNSVNDKTVNSQNLVSETHVSPSLIPADSVNNEKSAIEVIEPVSCSNDTVSLKSSEEIFGKDLSEQSLYAYNDESISPKLVKHGGWSFKVGVNSEAIIYDFSNVGDASSNNYGSLGNIIDEIPSEEDQDKKPQKVRAIKRNYKEVAHTNDFPIVVATTVSKPVSRFFGVETGLTYTYLHSTFEKYGHSSDCRWNYLGIPLKITVNNYSSKYFNLYATAGIQLDIPVYSTASTLYVDNKLDLPSTSGVDSKLDLPNGRFHSPVVWSVSASYGISFNITKRIGIFVEPSIQYHFDHNYEVPNIWTDSKLIFSLPIGFRLNI